MIETKIIPDDGIRPKEAKLKEAADLKTSLAAGKMMLFKQGAVAINDLTSAADLAAGEADFDGYTTGGIAVANFGDPILDTDGTVLVVSPLVQFNYTDGVDHVSNEIGGAAYIDAGTKVRGVVQFDPPVTLATNDDGVPVVLAFRVK